MVLLAAVNGVLGATVVIALSVLIRKAATWGSNPLALERRRHDLASRPRSAHSAAGRSRPVTAAMSRG